MTGHSEREAWHPPNPKLVPGGRGWYRYYAGYSIQFVTDVLTQIGPPLGATVLDPWNGSGTTTAAASRAGYAAVGLDANPALVIVALGRQLDRGAAASLPSLARDLIRHAKEERAVAIADAKEPLTAWFDTETAHRVRAIERSVQRMLVNDSEPQAVAHRGLEGISTLAAFFYVALFELTRSQTSAFRTSNPTWIKVASPEVQRVARSWGELETAFLNAVAHLEPSTDVPRAHPSASIRSGNSTSIPMPSDSVDLTITSPPYCTRIDYVVATLPELAVLGFGGRDAIHSLRSKMVGTPTMWSKGPTQRKAWGKAANSVLDEIAVHPSRASATYYFKYFAQYFQSMWRSLSEIERVSKDHAPLVIVAQDSYYKELHVDLPTILAEMVTRRGWTTISASAYQTPVTKAAINPGARKYRNSFGATEAVLVCRR